MSAHELAAPLRRPDHGRDARDGGRGAFARCSSASRSTCGSGSATRCRTSWKRDSACCRRSNSAARASSRVVVAHTRRESYAEGGRGHLSGRARHRQRDLPPRDARHDRSRAREARRPHRTRRARRDRPVGNGAGGRRPPRTRDWPIQARVRPRTTIPARPTSSTPAGVFQFAAAPIALQDTVIGTLQLAKALDEQYAQELSTISGTATLIASGDRIIASTLPADVSRSLTPETLRALPSSETVDLAGSEYAVKLLFQNGDTAVYALDSIAAVDARPDAGSPGRGGLTLRSVHSRWRDSRASGWRGRSRARSTRSRSRCRR